MLLSICQIEIKNIFPLTFRMITYKTFSVGGRSSVGRAPVCGTGCRQFEPDRPPHFLCSPWGVF